ncbi:MAG TPA: hypothetical protein VMA98_10765 [Candidatus Acidoferrales bacterium]|nr:hypothetical protein [Candidatus Acidoferrales bacterium]
MATFSLSPAVRTALERLIDYAGLFPPAQLPMDGALAQYERARSSAASWMLGRFIVPAARLAEVTMPFELSVIATPQAFEGVARAREHGARVGALEVPPAAGAAALAAAQAARTGLSDLPMYVEVLDTSEIPAIAEHGLGAKLRCGGLEPSAYPSVERVAAFIAAAAASNVPFKATAGLHHPVRHFNAAAGVKMHGFLNLLVAASRAGEASLPELAAIIAEEDPSALSLSDEAALRQARARFVGYGSCSFDEPVDDLRALHVIAA